MFRLSFRVYFLFCVLFLSACDKKNKETTPTPVKETVVQTSDEETPTSNIENEPKPEIDTANEEVVTPIKQDDSTNTPDLVVQDENPVTQPEEEIPEGKVDCSNSGDLFEGIETNGDCTDTSEPVVKPIEPIAVKPKVKPVYAFNFVDQKDGSATQWLNTNSFKLEQDAAKLNPKFKDGKFVLQAKKETFGYFTHKLSDLKADKLVIKWGVNKFPKGADWKNGILREPIAVIVSFGTKTFSSGSMFVPNVPYFICIFLEQTAEEDKLYKGNYWHEGGRYYSAKIDQKRGKTITTTLDLKQLFKRSFQSDSMPNLSGMAIEVDTTKTKGKSKAFIESIEFFNN